MMNFGRHKNYTVPILIFLLFAGLYISLSAWFGSDFIFRPAWDIGHYQSIAEGGYIARPCDPAVDYPMGEICGNVGWFPGWPLTVKILSLGQVAYGLKILPYIFTLAGFIFFYRFLRNHSGSKAAIIGTIALAASPTAFYFLTGFPYAFLLFLFMAYLFYLYAPRAGGRKYLLPIIAFIFSLTYPPAFVMALIPMVRSIIRFRNHATTQPAGKAVLESLYYIVPFALGPLVLSLYFWIKFDDFMMIIHFQEKYDRQWGFPGAVIWQSLKNFQFTCNAYFMDPIHSYFHANFVILWYGLIYLVFIPYRVRTELVLFSLCLFLFSPTTGSVFSIWRHYLLLFPAAMIIGSSGRSLPTKIIYLALGLFLALAIYFPEYIDGFLV